MAPELLPHISTEQLKRWREGLLGVGGERIAATVLHELLSREIAHPDRQARDPSTPHRDPVNNSRQFAADTEPMR